jgi:hypothetical protein
MTTNRRSSSAPANLCAAPCVLGGNEGTEVSFPVWHRTYMDSAAADGRTHIALDELSCSNQLF